MEKKCQNRWQGKNVRIVKIMLTNFIGLTPNIPEIRQPRHAQHAQCRQLNSDRSHFANEIARYGIESLQLLLSLWMMSFLWITRWWNTRYTRYTQWPRTWEYSTRLWTTKATCSINVSTMWSGLDEYSTASDCDDDESTTAIANLYTGSSMYSELLFIECICICSQRL